MLPLSIHGCYGKSSPYCLLPWPMDGCYGNMIIPPYHHPTTCCHGLWMVAMVNCHSTNVTMAYEWLLWKIITPLPVAMVCVWIEGSERLERRVDELIEVESNHRTAWAHWMGTGDEEHPWRPLAGFPQGHLPDAHHL